MGNRIPMDLAPHPWQHTHTRNGRRLALGFTIALALTLVAFEWRGGTGALPKLPWTDMAEETVLEILPPVVIEQPTAMAAKRPRARATTVVAAPEVVPQPDPMAVPDPAATAGEPVEGPATEASPTDLAAPAGGGTYTLALVGIRPHFRECMLRDPSSVDACTEVRIRRHLERHFRVPAGVRAPVRTTVTFAIDTLGQVGRPICAPRVSSAVEAEVERVLRTLPRFEPGMQGDHKVPVYYQIPLSVQVR